MDCSFCKNEIGLGRGKIIVQADGSPKYYCSSKCERNARIRNPRKVRWTDIYHKEKKARIKK